MPLYIVSSIYKQTASMQAKLLLSKTKIQIGSLDMQTLVYTTYNYFSGKKIQARVFSARPVFDDCVCL